VGAGGPAPTRSIRRLVNIEALTPQRRGGFGDEPIRWGPMASRELEVVLAPEEDGGYSDCPGAPRLQPGETREEAHAMIREAIEPYLESLEAHGDPFPARSRSSASPSPRDAAATCGVADPGVRGKAFRRLTGYLLAQVHEGLDVPAS